MGYRASTGLGDWLQLRPAPSVRARKAERLREPSPKFIVLVVAADRVHHVVQDDRSEIRQCRIERRDWGTFWNALGLTGEVRRGVTANCAKPRPNANSGLARDGIDRRSAGHRIALDRVYHPVRCLTLGRSRQ